MQHPDRTDTGNQLVYIEVGIKRNEGFDPSQVQMVEWLTNIVGGPYRIATYHNFGLAIDVFDVLLDVNDKIRRRLPSIVPSTRGVAVPDLEESADWSIGYRSETENPSSDDLYQSQRDMTAMKRVREELNSVYENFYIKTNVEVTEERRPDFDGVTKIIGGPVTNDCANQVLNHYGKHLPYNFGVPGEYSDLSRQELRHIGYSTHKGEKTGLSPENYNLHHPPNYAFVDRSENIATIDNEKLKPKEDESADRYETDYWMIMIGDNPLNDNRYNNKCVLFAGCHGFGTSAAALKYQDFKFRNELERVLSDVGGVVYGKVQRDDGADPGRTYANEEDHIEPLEYQSLFY